MDFNYYQKKALTTDSYNADLGEVAVTEMAFVAKILGLVGESGEVAEKFKKIIRNQGGKLKLGDKEEITKELGDVLWYIAVIAKYLNVEMQEVAEVNLQKLSDRKKRSVISSEGDNR